MGASAELIRLTGIDVIQTESERLGSLLENGLRERGFKISSPISKFKAFVTFSRSNSSDISICTAALKKAQISFALRGPGIRLSTHAYNTDEDISFALKTLEPYAR